MRTPSIATTQYFPKDPPNSAEALKQYLFDELMSISAAVSRLTDGHLDKEHVAPEKPRDGDMRYADGTDWNPGSGAGMYLFNGTTWEVLGVGTLADEFPSLKPPLAGISGSGSVAIGSIPPVCAGVTTSTTTSTTDVEVVSVTGSGVLELAAVITTANVAQSATLTVVIDGTTFTATTGAAQYNAVAIGGAIMAAGATFSILPFKTSLSIKHKVSAATQTSRIYHKYWQAT